MRNHRLHTRPGIPTRRAPRLRVLVDEPTTERGIAVPLLVEGCGDGMSRPRGAAS